jgi:hypothetical protein
MPDFADRECANPSEKSARGLQCLETRGWIIWEAQTTCKLLYSVGAYLPKCRVYLLDFTLADTSADVRPVFAPCMHNDDWR